MEKQCSFDDSTAKLTTSDNTLSNCAPDLGTATSDDDDDDDAGIYDDWNEEDYVTIKSFFSEIYFPSIQAVLNHDRENFNFDFVKILIEIECSDELQLIMIVNYIRKEYDERIKISTADSVFVEALICSIHKKLFLDEANMKPFIADDPMLFLLSGHLSEIGALAIDFDDDLLHKNEIEDNMIAQQQSELLRENIVNYQEIIDELGR